MKISQVGFILGYEQKLPSDMSGVYSLKQMVAKKLYLKGHLLYPSCLCPLLHLLFKQRNFMVFNSFRSCSIGVWLVLILLPLFKICLFCAFTITHHGSSSYFAGVSLPSRIKFLVKSIQSLESFFKCRFSISIDCPSKFERVL